MGFESLRPSQTSFDLRPHSLAGPPFPSHPDSPAARREWERIPASQPHIYKLVPLQQLQAKSAILAITDRWGGDTLIDAGHLFRIPTSIIPIFHADQFLRVAVEERRVWRKLTQTAFATRDRFGRIHFGRHTGV